MTPRFQLEVTADHIARGKRFDSACCPVAMAFEEAFPGFRYYVCSDEVIVFRRQNDNYWQEITSVRLSSQVIDFIERFDAKLDVKPFSFPVEIAEPVSMISWSAQE